MNLVKSFSIYTISGLLSKALSFLLLPFFTNHLSQSDYGVITLFSNSIYFVLPFMFMGIGETLSVEYNSLTAKELPRFISTSLIFSIITFIISLFSILFFGTFLSMLTGLNIKLLYLVCILSGFNFFVEYVFIIFRNQHKSLHFALLSISKTVIELSVSIYLIGQCNQGAMGRINGLLISSGVCFVIILIYFFNKGYLNSSFSKNWFIIILKRGLPTIPFFFMIFILNNSDNYFIKFFHGNKSIGVYALACQIALVVNLISSSFMMSFYPFFYKSLLDKHHNKILRVIFVYIFIIILSILLLFVFSPLLFKHFINEKFIDSLQYVFLLSLGQMWWAFFLIILSYLYYKKENTKLYYLSISSIIFTITIDYFIIKQHDSINWAWANMLSFLFCFLFISYIYRKQIFFNFIFIIKQLFRFNFSDANRKRGFKLPD